MISKNRDHQYKECEKNLPTCMHLLKHIAEHHYKDDGETKETYAEGHPEYNAILYGFETKQKECHVQGIEDKKEFSSVFQESMLDEFL